MKKTTQEAAAELLQHGLTLVSEYAGAHKLLVFTCQNGHVNTALATNVIRRGYKCKECLHGRKIESKISWTEDKLLKLRELIKTTDLDTIAKEFSTTVDAINNCLAKHNISNSKIPSSYNSLLEELAIQGRTLTTSQEEYLGTHSHVVIKCKNGHQVKQNTANVIYKHTGCPECTFIEGTSKQESELLKFIEDNYDGWIIQNDRTILNGKELDIVLPDLGLAFEFNGTYWHSRVDINYHLDKTKAVEDFGYQLVHITDYDWNNSKDIIKSQILNKLGKSRTIFARSCIYREIPFPAEFLNKNHIQGAGGPTSKNLGLFYKDELVAVMTFSKPRFDNNHDLELVRYATKLNTRVVGGASKLLSKVSGSIVTYARRDYSQGKLYDALKFKLLHYTDPGYAYYRRNTKVSRYQAQKHKLSGFLKTFDPRLTEEQNMLANGYYKYYDSGNMVFSTGLAH